MNLDIAMQFARGDYESSGEHEARLGVSINKFAADSPTAVDEMVRSILDRTYKLAHAQPEQPEEFTRTSENGHVTVIKRIPTSLGIVFDEETIYGGKVSPDRFINFAVFVRRPDMGDELHR